MMWKGEEGNIWAEVQGSGPQGLSWPTPPQVQTDCVSFYLLIRMHPRNELAKRSIIHPISHPSSGKPNRRLPHSTLSATSDSTHSNAQPQLYR